MQFTGGCFWALSNGDFASMVGVQLFFQESWYNNESPYKDAGIPEQDRQFKPIWEIGIVKHQKGVWILIMSEGITIRETAWSLQMLDINLACDKQSEIC